MAFSAALLAVGVFGGSYASKKMSPKPSGAAAPNAQPPALPPPPPVTPVSALEQVAASAGVQVKKKITSNVGRGDTILTGPNGLGAVAPQNSQTKTLLGL